MASTGFERRRPRHVVVMALGSIVLIVASACSSTKSVDGRATKAGSKADSADSEVADAVNGGASSNARSAAGGGNGRTGSGVLAGGPGGGAVGSSPDGVPVPTSKFIPAGKGVHGVTDKAIKVGLYTINAAAFGAAVTAVSGQETNISGDYKRSGEAVIAYINKTGGIAGRLVEPVWFEVNPAAVANPEGRSREGQDVCAKFTEDEKVFAFQVHVSKNTIQCAQDTNTVVLGNGFQPYLTEREFARAPVWYAEHWMIAERRERNTVEGLAKQGFFTRGAKVAIMIEGGGDSSAEEAVNNAMIPALKRLGISPELRIVYPDIIESQWDNYVLQMKSRGITHVLMSETYGCIWSTLFMMKSAENQEYRPRWGLASDNCPGGLNQLGAPREQLKKVTGVGWIPVMDVGASARNQSVSGATCDKIAKSVGQPEGVAGPYCVVLFLLKAALSHATEVSPAGMSRALGAVGSSYLALATHDGRTLFSASKHDGSVVYRGIGFDTKCGEEGNTCMRYTTGLLPLS